MTESFRIRPKQHQYESLTGYLMRISVENGFKIYKVFDAIGVRYDTRNAIDIFPVNIVNIYNLKTLLKMDIDTLLKMSLWPIFAKFISNKSIQDNFQSAYSKDFLTRNRRFCVSCLNDFGSYKLLWQVKELKICDIHHTELQSACKNCGMVQPYISNNLSIFKCTYCNSSLLNQFENKIENKKVIEEQVQKYNDWYFLFNSEKNLYSEINTLSLEKSIAALVLYIAQGKAEVFNYSNLLFYDHNTVLDYLRLINGKKGRNVTIGKLLHLLRHVGMSISDVNKIEIPNKFIQSLYYSEKRNYIPVACISPWCTSYGTNNTLIKIKTRKRKTNSDGKRKQIMNNIFVCTECYMQYGFNSSNGSWEEVYNNIELIWNKVLPELKAGSKVYNISERLGIDGWKVLYAHGYAINHALFPVELSQYKYREFTNQELLEYFNELSNMRGSMLENSRRKFNWSTAEYYYYFTKKEVQSYLITNKFNKESISEKGVSPLYEIVKEKLNYFLDNDIDISLKSVSESINYSATTIRSHKLGNVIKKAAQLQVTKRKKDQVNNIKARIKEYFADSKNINVYTCKQVYKDLNLRLMNQPEFKKLSKIVFDYVIVNREKRRLEFIEQYKKLAEEAVYKLYSEGKNISIKNVSKSISVDYKTLRSLTDVTDVIIETRSKIYNLLLSSEK